MKKGNADSYRMYLSGITSMFDLSYSDKPKNTSKKLSDINSASQEITEQAFNMTGAAIKQAIHKYESKFQ